ncbi:hypothetical protein P7K49_024037 [Saguinus oedipus]|uniref:Uncharacterized protein n=1 Tax=Saguinus oedipus TaxID=9490 RepID=A0ABQ9UP25_SAGOE|nr:hypothetical protein P7K49_024037 [Saguinus oedipus]
MCSSSFLAVRHLDLESTSLLFPPPRDGEVLGDLLEFRGRGREQGWRLAPRLEGGWAALENNAQERGQRSPRLPGKPNSLEKLGVDSPLFEEFSGSLGEGRDALTSSTGVGR